MTKTIENLFRYLHVGTDLLVILLFILFFKRIRQDKGLFYIGLYCVCDLVFNLINNYNPSKLNNYLSAFFTFFEYSLFTYFIYINLINKKIKTIIAVLSTGFVLFIIVFDFVTKFQGFDSIPIGIESILIIIFSFYFLFEQMNDLSNLFVYSRYQFWVVIGIMLYLAGSFFIYILASHIKSDLLGQYWFLTNAFYSIMTSFFAIAFFIRGKNKNTNNNSFNSKFRLT